MLPRNKWEFRATSYSFFGSHANTTFHWANLPQTYSFTLNSSMENLFYPAAYYLIYYLSERFFTHNSQARDLLYIWGKRLLPTDTFFDCYRKIAIVFSPAGATIELWAVSVRSRKIRNCYWNDYFSLYYCVGDSHVQKIHKSCASIRFSFFQKRRERCIHTHRYKTFIPTWFYEILFLGPLEDFQAERPHPNASWRILV